MVLGDKHIHYHNASNNTPDEHTHNQTDAEDVEYEEVLTYCTYLDIEQINASGIRKPLEVQQMLEEASTRDAKVFAKFLRDFERLHYLNFHGHTKRKVFNTLRAELPMMRRYKESNFYAAF